jgi:hypothetical protein
MRAERMRLGVGLAVVLSVLMPDAAAAQQLELDRLTRLTEQAAEVVDVNVDPTMLAQLVKGLAAQANDEKLKKLIAGLKGIFVKGFEFNQEGAYTDADVEAIRSQLKAPWSRMISVREKGESFELYLWMQNDQPEGLALIAAEPKELTVVNIVGRIDLAALGALSFIGIPGDLQNLLQTPR